MRFYAGIGSRETPINVQRRMESLARNLFRHGYTLRSGAARGADAAFERGAGEYKEIFLPWSGFNGHPSTMKIIDLAAAEAVAARYHPVWNRLNISARKMHTRNVAQILGADLNTPVEFVVCWTKDGKFSGGTGQALRIADDLKIPIYNLYNSDDAERLNLLLETIDL